MKTICTDSIKFEIEGITYTWFGHFGRVFSSRERGMKVGNLRAFGETIFKVRDVRESWFTKSTVVWVPVADVSIDWIDNFKKSILGV
jgi:hypothetical protein